MWLLHASAPHHARETGEQGHVIPPRWQHSGRLGRGYSHASAWGCAEPAAAPEADAEGCALTAAPRAPPAPSNASLLPSGAAGTARAATAHRVHTTEGCRGASRGASPERRGRRTTCTPLRAPMRALSPAAPRCIPNDPRAPPCQRTARARHASSRQQSTWPIQAPFPEKAPVLRRRRGRCSSTMGSTRGA